MTTNPTKQPDAGQVGTLFTTGPVFSRRTWELYRKTDCNLFMRELVWSKDCINESGVMYRTANVLRVKIQKYLYKKSVGSFDLLTESREVRDSK